MERVRCPVCAREFRADLEAPRRTDEDRFFPFCSERCRALDLGRWVDEEYRIPEKLTPGPEETEEP